MWLVTTAFAEKNVGRRLSRSDGYRPGTAPRSPRPDAMMMIAPACARSISRSHRWVIEKTPVISTRIAVPPARLRIVVDMPGVAVDGVPHEDVYLTETLPHLPHEVVDRVRPSEIEGQANSFRTIGRDLVSKPLTALKVR